MEKDVANYIRGAWEEGSGPELTSVNPATGEIVWQGKSSSPEDVSQAISSAEEILPQWMATSLERRIEILQQFKRVLDNSKEYFAETIASETGKPLWEATSEVDAMLNKIPLSIQAYKDRCPEKEQELKGVQSHTRHKPQGVVAVLGPYNLPGHLANGHIIPALLAGNTIVFKPSEKTPLIGMRMIERWEKSGLPAGAINLVQGDASVGKALVEHPALNGLFFTGSDSTGRQLKKAFLDRPGTILALEMGGNNPLIVSDVKDLPSALSTILVSAFITTGQRCTCARRLYLPNGKKGDLLLEGLIASAKELSIGAYNDDPPPFMGPMIDVPSAQNVLDQFESLKNLGGTPLLPPQPLEKGLPWLSPGIIDMTSSKTHVDQEIFGPLLKVFRYGDLDEAIEKANETTYGLSAGLLSDSREEYELFYQNIRAGVVNWNTPLTGASSAAPFGGIGRSGNFHPSAYYAPDYCSYPVASMEAERVQNQADLFPGMTLHLPAEHGSQL